MNKLKTQKFNNLLNYQHFLKNNSLKKKRYKLKNILFENQILYKNQGLDLKIIELENSENISIPSTVLDFNNFSTIQNLYENKILFNYNLNYNILHNFNKILFNYKKKKDNIIKSRLATGDHKKIIIAFLGKTFSMKPFNLNNRLNFKKIIQKRKKFKKKIFKHKNFKNKKKKVKKLVQSYILRYLNFKIKTHKKKYIFSRISYIDDIIKYLPIKNWKKRMLLERKKKKSNLSRKGYVKKKQNKTNYATI